MRPNGSVTSEDHAARLILYGPEGVVTSSDGGGATQLERIELPDDGNYTIVATTEEVSNFDSGTYDSISEARRDTFSYQLRFYAQLGISKEISVGGIQNGSINSNDNYLPSQVGFYDSYTFFGTEDESISAELRPEDPSQHATRLILYGPGGVVTSSDGGGATQLEQVELPEDGNYTIVATTEEVSNFDSGTYDSISEARTDVFDYQLRLYQIFSSQTGIPYGTSNLGELSREDNFQNELSGYYDAYAVPASSGDRFSVELRPEDPQRHAAKLLIYGPDGSITYSHLSGGTARIEQYVAEHNGSYTVVATTDEDAEMYDATSDARRDTFEYVLNVSGPNNNPPIAIADAPRRVAPGQQVDLSASKSFDVNGDAIEYDWRQQTGLFDPSVPLSHSDTATPTFVAPNFSESERLDFVVTASDDRGGQTTDQVNVTVDPAVSVPPEDEPPTPTPTANDTEIKDQSLEIDPFPVPSGDAPTVSINASNATTVFLNTSVGDQTACTPMRNVGGNEWEVDLGRVDSPDLDGLNRGSRVNISIVTASENCGGTRYDVLNQTSEAFPLTDLPTDDSRATYPSQVVQKQPLHYHVFDDVVQVSVVVADYEGQEHVWENETLREWKQAIEYDTNSYLGSDRGAMGSIGFDLQYFDDGGDLYELQSKSAYTSVDPTAPLNSGVTRFTEDARSVALGDNTGRFVVASPTTLGNAQVFEPPFASVSTDAPYRAYVPVYKSSGVWVEELSHLYLGMGDLYSVSNTGNVVGGIRTGDASSGIMASYNGRPGIRLPAPYSVFSRTRLNDLGPRDSVDDEWPWVSINQRRLAPGSGNQGSVTVSAHRPSNLNIGDTVEVVNTNKRVVIGEIEATSVTGRVGTGTVKYAFEVREESRQVRGYRFVEGTSPTGSLISATNVSSGTVDGERSYVTNGLFVEFSTTDRLVDGEYQPEVTTEYTASGANTVVGSITSTVSERLSATFLERPNVTAPDVDLRAVDSQGRVTGVTETGEFVNEIPGARASGDRIGSIEWIAVPRNSSVEFVVSSVDAQEFLNQTNKSAENLNLSYRTEVTEVGGDPRLISDNGSVSVTDTTTEVTNQSIKPGQARTVSNNTSSDLDNRSLPRIVGDAPPTDPDNDNLYEDINGDGEISYVDVVKLFETFGSGIIENNPSIFDFNDNGRVDFDDIVTIFKEIIE
jgi:hypothetical protein